MYLQSVLQRVAGELRQRAAEHVDPAAYLTGVDDALETAQTVLAAMTGPVSLDRPPAARSAEAGLDTVADEVTALVARLSASARAREVDVDEVVDVSGIERIAAASTLLLRAAEVLRSGSTGRSLSGAVARTRSAGDRRRTDAAYWLAAMALALGDRGEDPERAVRHLLEMSDGDVAVIVEAGRRLGDTPGVREQRRSAAMALLAQALMGPAGHAASTVPRDDDPVVPRD